MARALAMFAILFTAVGCSFLGGSGLTLDADALELDGISAAVVTLSNHGPVASDWEMLYDATWLAASPAGGTLGPWESTPVVIEIDRAYPAPVTGVRLERSPGTYFSTVTATSAGGADSLNITFRVNEEPSADACAPAAAAQSVSPWTSQPDRLESVRSDRTEPRASHVLIKVRDGGGADVTDPRRSDLRLDDVVQAFGLTQRRSGPGRAVQVVRIPEGSDPDALVARLARDPRIEWAEIDRPLYPQQTLTNDPELPHQWAACRFGLPAAWNVWSGAAIDGPDAPKGTIAVIDSGVDLDHPDLLGRVLPGYDFCPVGSGATASSCSSVAPEPGGEPGSDLHGTHVAGIAAAIGDNGLGIAGVAWGGARILPVKVFDDGGSVTSIAAVACGIYWSIGSTDPAEICGASPNPHPARILNLSLGGPGTSSALDEAVAAASARGALVFAATGNGSSLVASRGIFMPASAPDAIAVGSVNSNFERSSFSRFDVLGGATVDLMAPGGYLLADGTTVFSTTYDDSYGMLGGTSMATPYAAGVAALLWTLDPSASSDEIYAQMRGTTYFAPGWKSYEYGAGIVCADAALGLATRCGLPD